MRTLLRVVGSLALVAAAFTFAQPARANILIQVDKHAQQMTVTVDGDPRYVWPVSTGMGNYNTPSGQFTPFRMEKDHFSREWDDAPMPYSIFFTKQGHAIHGTNHKIDGEAHSHGCVRLSVKHAAMLWDLVKQEGMANVRVELGGRIPTHAEAVARREAPPMGPATREADVPPPPEQRQASAYAEDPDTTGAIPGTLPQGNWREYREGGQVYYYRDGPDETERLAPVRRSRRYYPPRLGGFPFW